MPNYGVEDGRGLMGIQLEGPLQMDRRAFTVTPNSPKLTSDLP